MYLSLHKVNASSEGKITNKIRKQSGWANAYY
jgi:hypothetical protein